MLDDGSFQIRIAGPADILTIARQRAAMFDDMKRLTNGGYHELVDESARFLERALPAGEYRGWLAIALDEPREVIGGAGVQLRRVMPFPRHGSDPTTIATGRQAIVVNVYTDPRWRGRGVARALVEAIVRFARVERLDSLVLHASEAGRPLYEKLGFVATNEMRYMGSLVEAESYERV